jgi:hypothetical protein
MEIKIVDNFDASFTLEPDAQTALFQSLSSEAFLRQITSQSQCSNVKFIEKLFQPVPYSASTPHGMPTDFEPYFRSSDYVIINVPANFMFHAKIIKPSRLCAVYQKIST